jgi:DNA-directed RNA polymerase specialized sigma24 family protein
VDELVKYLKALVYLQVQTMSGGEAFQKPEVLLNRAGLATREIAEILGKSPAAVAKAIERAKKASRMVGTGTTANGQGEESTV